MNETRSDVDDFIESDDITIQQILNNLLDGKKNLDLKSHIFKPKQLASLYSFAENLKTNKLPKSSKVIINFIKRYLRYMVSYKRYSRNEIIKAVSTYSHKDNIDGTSKFTEKLD